MFLLLLVELLRGASGSKFPGNEAESTPDIPFARWYILPRLLYLLLDGSGTWYHALKARQESSYYRRFI